MPSCILLPSQATIPSEISSEALLSKESRTCTTSRRLGEDVVDANGQGNGERAMNIKSNRQTTVTQGGEGKMHFQ